MIVTKNFSPKIILVTNFVVPKKFQSQKFYSYKKVLVQKNLAKKFLATKKSQSQKIFSHKKMFSHKKI